MSQTLHGAHRYFVTNAVRSEIQRLVNDKGLPRHVAERHVALGSYRIQRAVKEQFGWEMHRSTIIKHLSEILGRPVGQLPARSSLPQHRRKGHKPCPGAYCYSLRTTRQGRRIWESIRTSLRSVSSTKPSLVTKQCWYNARVDGALEWAVSNANKGRNSTGFWLANRCRRLLCSFAEAQTVMRSYQQRVVGLGDHPYTVAEALATTRSAYKYTD